MPIAVHLIDGEVHQRLRVVLRPINGERDRAVPGTTDFTTQDLVRNEEAIAFQTTS
jgi:hypothetical protein